AGVQGGVGLEAWGVEVEGVVVVSGEVALLEPDALQVESLPGRGEALLEGSLPRRQEYEAGEERAGVGRGLVQGVAVGEARGLEPSLRGSDARPALRELARPREA